MIIFDSLKNYYFSNLCDLISDFVRLWSILST